MVCGKGVNMLKLEQRVPSLSLCKKLKSISYPQEGLFWWKRYYKTDKYFLTDTNNPEAQFMTSGVDDYIVAPTVAEMGEWLPNYIDDVDGTGYGYHLVVWKTNNAYRVMYVHRNSTKFTNKIRVSRTDKTEANARAKILIWLVENKYIDFERFRG